MEEEVARPTLRLVCEAPAASSLSVDKSVDIEAVREVGKYSESNQDVRGCAEGEGLEPPSPCGQRFSSYEHGVLTLSVMA
jgi:hypothetical protein